MKKKIIITALEVISEAPKAKDRKSWLNTKLLIAGINVLGPMKSYQDINGNFVFEGKALTDA